MCILSFIGGLIAGTVAAFLLARILHRRQYRHTLRFIHDCRHLHPANTVVHLQRNLQAMLKRRL